MTALDTKFRALAVKMINKYGKTVTLSSVTTGTYNPATGAVTNTTATASVKAIVEDYSQFGNEQKFTEGLVRIGDKKFTVAAVGITEPKTGDTVTVDSSVYSVVRVTANWSGEQIATYEIQGRI